MLDKFPSFFHTNLSLFVLILVTLTGAALAYYQYRRTVPPVSGNLRIFLAILRGLAIAGILVLLFSPEITAVWQLKEKPRLAILLDRSASMGISEGGQQRLQRGLAAAERITGAVGDQADIFMYAFDIDTVHLYNWKVDTTRMGTDISSTLSSVVQDQAPPADIVLITDGNFTVGNNPLYLDVGSQVRVFTVGIGDTVESPDLIVTDIQTSKIIYQNQPTEIQAMIMPRGIDNARISLRLVKGRRILRVKEVQLGRRDEQCSVAFEFTPEKTGPQQFRIEAMPLPEESFTRNNTFTFSIDVLKGRIRVGLLSGQAGYENRFMHLMLSGLKDIDLKSSVLRTDGRYYLNRAPSIIDSLDVLILENFPAPYQASAEALTVMKKAAAKRIPALVMLAQPPPSQALEVVREIFPLTALQKSTTPQMIQVHLTREGRFLPLLSVFNNEAEEQKFWMSNPPIEYNFDKADFDERVRILLVSYTPGKEEEQGKPVICAYSGKGYRSLLFLGAGFWRWSFVQAEDRIFNGKWQQILRNMIRWLDSESANKNVILSASQKKYEIGSSVKLQTQVYDLSYQPLNDATIRVTVNGPVSPFEIESAFTGDGTYESTFNPLEPGEYVIRAEAWRNDVRIGEDRLVMPVLPVNQEFMETTQNVRLLKKLAAENGGHYAAANEVEKIIPMIRTESFRKEKKDTIELWNRLPVLVLIIGLLCLEWSIRKRKGLA
jgi:hypothetical protein